MSIEANKAVVLRHLDEAWNQNRVAELDEYVSPQHMHYSGNKSHIFGPEQIRELIKVWLAAAPDFKWHVEQLIAEGDLVVARVTFTGTHTGPHQVAGRMLPASGNAFSEAEIVITRVADGKIIESWSAWDRLSLLEQLGAKTMPD